MDIDRSLLLKGYVVCVFAMMMGGLLFVSSTTGQDGGSQPDITVKDIQFSGEELMEGDNIMISASIYNNGSRQIDDLTMIYKVDNIEIVNITGIRVNGSATKTINISWEAKKGNHDVSVVVEYKGKPIQEGRMSKELYVEPEPIGDIFSLMFSLGMIILVIFSVIIMQSIRKSVRS